MKNDQLLTVREIAELTNDSRENWHKRIRKGELQVVYLSPRQPRISFGEYKKWLRPRLVYARTRRISRKRMDLVMYEAALKAAELRAGYSSRCRTDQSWDRRDNVGA